MIQLDNYIGEFFQNQTYYTIYPVILLGGSIISALLTETQRKDLINTIPLAQSKNQINQIFAYNGNLIFLIVFIGLTLTKILHIIETRILAHPSDGFSVIFHQTKNATINILIKNLIKFTIKYTSLYALFYFIDNVFYESGGRCQISQSVANTLALVTDTSEQCLKYNGTWVKLKQGFCSLTPHQFSEVIQSAEVCRKYGKWEGGFDISGHFCFLVTISLIIFNELRVFDNHDENERLLDEKYHNEINGWSHITIVSFWKWISLITLAIWTSLLVITSVFYHSFTEKLVGMILGYICPIIIYVALPKLWFWNLVFS